MATAMKTKAKSAAKPKAPARKPKPSSRNAPLAPHITCRDAAKAIEFYKKAFDAKELMRLPGPDGKLMHAAVEINGAMVMLNDEWPAHNALSPLALKGTPVTLHLNVPDVDKWFARAVKAGAKVTMPVADMFWGDRYGIVTDPFGHAWSIATHKKDMTIAEIQKAMKSMGAPDCPEVGAAK
ncbi:MAG: VOC family protein [Hyphomicrobium sp.]|jgi:PhnB protein